MVYPGAAPRVLPNCTVYPDAALIHGLFPVERESVHTIFDAAKLAFIEHSRVQLDSLPRTPSAVGVLL